MLLLLLHRPLYIFCKRPQTCTQLTNARICGETRDSNTIVSVPLAKSSLSLLQLGLGVNKER